MKYIVLLLSILSLTGCFQSDEPAMPELNIYTARHYETDQLVYDEFTKQTGIKINLVQGNGSDLEKRIRSEGELCPADVFITVDIGRIWKAEDSGFFQPLKSDFLEERIPDHLRHSKGLWFGITKRARVIFYLKEEVNPDSLTTYESLADPKFRGKILIRSSSNVYNQSLLASLITHHGEDKAREWAKGIVANFARKPQSNDTGQLRALAAGEGDLAIANTYYYYRLLKSDKPEDQEVVSKIGIYFPNQTGRGAHINISGAGVLKHSKNKEAAKKFIEFLAGDFAQEVMANGNNEYPVVLGVKMDDIVGSHRFKEDMISAESIGKNSPMATKIFDQAGWR